MRTITNVCKSCKRENIPDNEYLESMNLCGDCVAGQMEQSQEQLKQMKQGQKQIEKAEEQIKQMRDQISRLEQSVNQNKQINEQLLELRKLVSGLEKSKEDMTRRAASSTVFNSPPHGYVFVEGGTFMMGSPPGEEGRDNDEGPVHRVTVSSFYMKETAVTQAEWKAVMGSNPSWFKGEDRPVEQVNWYDAVHYCNTLSKKEGRSPVYRINGTSVTANWSEEGYRLPTEAEWEYAARGGKQSRGYKYAGSNKVAEVGWYWKNSGEKPLGGEWDINTIRANNGRTYKVGLKRANELGLYDMSGNVWEWCWDWYNSDYYSSSPGTNPTGPSSGSSRVSRGGSWYDIPELLRVAYRFVGSPGGSRVNLGFRLVLRTN